jgi:hypothetical protein
MKKKPSAKQNDRAHAELAIMAITCVGDICLSLRPDFPKNCIAASVAGAEALRRHGVDAKAEVVVAAFMSPDKGQVSWIGATAQDAYGYYVKYCASPLPFDEFCKLAQCEMPTEALHAVIRVSNPERSIIDLTSSQAPMGPEIVHLIFDGDDLPQHGIDSRGIHIVYEKKTNPPPLSEHTIAKVSGVVDDLLDAMDVAVACRFDRDLIMKIVRASRV